MSDAAQITLQVDLGPEADEEEVADATSRLQRELLDLDVDAVEPVRGGPAPAGTKAVDVLAIGGLVVTLANSAGLSAVVGTIRSWLSGGRERSVEIAVDGDVLKVTGVSSEEQHRLIDSWLERHADR